MTYLDDQKLSSLYEKFVKEYYRRHFPILNPVALPINWNVEDNEMIKLLPKMKTDEEQVPDQEYIMEKNKISIKTLDLTDNFEKVAEILDNIAYEFTNNEIKKINGA